MADRDEAISSFCELTTASEAQATEYLSAANWNLESAVTAFFADREDTAAGFDAAGSASPPPAAEPEYTGPRTLDGRPAPQYASGASSSKAASKKAPKRRGVATLGSIGNDDDDDDDDDSDDEGRGDLFAGGEKSGLAVQDPNQRSNDPKKLINDIIAKAKANSGRSRSSEPGPSDPSPGPSRFRGSGQTVGGDGVESRTIPDPTGNPIPTSASARGPEGPPQERVLHLWADGFSIDDGELRRFDDPENAMDLQMIRQGRAPLHLMNVRYDQPVDVKLQQHAENYRALPKVYRPFGGEGRRLGSPVPGDGNAAPTPPNTTNTTTSASGSGAQTPATQVDESQPTLLLRIQLPDGTRLPARFNTSQTVADVYDFVQRASADTQTRPWVLATTFPSKDHTDKGLVLGDMPEFKKGGTAVVKWT
ncbi:hypothetical protein GE09DRAFT_592759 [Coniochaeta sp. 2T2.1]|nr:hypothetical protein GE09DRAFT_592759 [Coniochaeta sp. 2T2.1]